MSKLSRCRYAQTGSFVKNRQVFEARTTGKSSTRLWRSSVYISMLTGVGAQPRRLVQCGAGVGQAKMDMPTKTVLVVDDYFDLLKLLGSALSRLGWDPSLAKNAAEAWEQIEQNSPGVILLDMWMEGMNGFQFAKKLKKHPVYKNIPILGTSAFAMSKADEASFRACCDDFLSKPFAISTLQQHLTALVAVNQADAHATAKIDKTH